MKKLRFGIRAKSISSMDFSRIRILECSIDLWDDRGWYVKTVYQAVAQTDSECMERFLTDPIIDGKRFWNIEKEMEWLDC